ncbi:hypothetical protein [Solimicrobium silvestre]|uniref:Uncharacterized protein n=1 Tax=Solimicrobium silvestre TaxID=2099400 RepID=A0A2S9GSH5_9BURK|nr:hypothetical protein [Solimicrobium silvestre]PRC90663.1 hypothetical protein S2091_4613 [Solimicrobium silvestre]
MNNYTIKQVPLIQRQGPLTNIYDLIAQSLLPVLLVSSTMLFTGCGGGGGGSSTTAASSSSSSAPTSPSSSAPTPTVPPAPIQAVVANYSVKTNVIPVTGAGKVFGMQANFFDDGFIPPNPISNWGFQNPLIPAVNADGSMDVAWLDYSGTSGPSTTGLSALGAINITHINPDLSTGSTMATGLLSYKLLGFTKDTAGAFYIAYNVDHPFKNAIAGDANNVNGNELHIAKSGTASFTMKTWDTLVFGDMDNTKDQSKGNPGEAGLGVLGFDVVNQKLALYVAHRMAWGDNGTRHQAGYFRYVDPASGNIVAPGNSHPTDTGTGWFYSHNFNQRLLLDNGTAYLLAHGDAYSRQLGFAAITATGYSASDSTVFNQSYLAINGTEGDNVTNTETGQFIKLSNGDFAIVYTTSQGRIARDVQIVIASGVNGTTKSSAWLTSNTGNIQAIMPKLEVSGNNILVSYGLWDSTTRTNKAIAWHFATVDTSLNLISASNPIPGIEFITDLPLIRFSSGPNVGQLAWVSGNGQGSLSVNLIQTP